jgi:hypothetical protein
MAIRVQPTVQTPDITLAAWILAQRRGGLALAGSRLPRAKHGSSEFHWLRAAVGLGLGQRSLDKVA